MAARRWSPRWLRRRRLVSVAAVVAVLMVAAGWVGWGTSLLGVGEVRVTGTEILSAEQVREQAAVPEQTPLLRVRTGEVADRVRELPPVAQVRVRRSWPDTVVIEIMERTAVAAVPTSGDFLLIDAEGVGFRSVAEPDPALPVVIVVEPGPDDPATAAALTVLAALTGPLRDELATLTVQGPASIRLELASGWTVVWGDAADSEEKARVTTELLDRDGEVIDVSAPEVVSVR